LFACQKADGNCLSGTGKECWCGIYAIRDHNDVRSILWNTKKKNHSRRWMLIYSVVLLHENVCPHTAARTRAVLKYFNCELFDHSSYSRHLALRDCQLFTYMKYWLQSQRLSNTDELMEGVKTAELAGGRLLWHRRTKTYSPIQVPQYP
jgi:hypothetical protein